MKDIEGCRMHAADLRSRLGKVDDIYFMHNLYEDRPMYHRMYGLDMCCFVKIGE